MLVERDNGARWTKTFPLPIDPDRNEGKDQDGSPSILTRQQSQAAEPHDTLPDDLKAFFAGGRPSVPIGSPPNIGFMGCFKDRSFQIDKDGSKHGFYVGKITSCPAGHRYSDGCGWWKEPVVLTGINLDGQPTDGLTTGIPDNFVFRAVEVVKGVPCYGSKDCTLYVYKLAYDLNQYKDDINKQVDAKMDIAELSQDAVTSVIVGKWHRELDQVIIDDTFWADGKAHQEGRDLKKGGGWHNEGRWGIDKGVMIVPWWNDGWSTEIWKVINAKKCRVTQVGNVLKGKSQEVTFATKLVSQQPTAERQVQPQEQPRRQPEVQQPPASSDGLVGNKTLIGRYGSFDSAWEAKRAQEQRNSGMNDAMAEAVANGGNGIYTGGASPTINYKIEAERDSNGNLYYALYRFSNATPYTPLRRLQ